MSNIQIKNAVADNVDEITTLYLKSVHTHFKETLPDEELAMWKYENESQRFMNTELAIELREMAERDQQLLQELFETGELPSAKYHPQMRALHESNTSALKEIIRKYGWPGISLVGAEGAESAWLIAQHAVSDTKFMSDCIELLKIAKAAGDVEGWQLAFLEDRVRTMSGKDQIYGTQFNVDEEGWPIPCPITEPETVNERRKALGLNSLEERLEEMRERERQRRTQQSATKALQRKSR
ncbi:DUF6624 domain-containing protein [uncultured Desulfobacter sp.]|uniref:DUF6624 domain-containing protein n=1 Tax=uncultured Desulfobacter sp. TaxID=240139 RepID=UPI0029F518CA|nr:DUF6624 domain-containing protein [uncultured Desulfobacter sp.]